MGANYVHQRFYHPNGRLEGWQAALPCAPAPLLPRSPAPLLLCSSAPLLPSTANGQRIATRVNDALYYIHDDPSGTITDFTNAAGTQVGYTRYDPLGGVLDRNWPDGPTG